MGLDVTIKEVQEFRCPDCGKLVTTRVVDMVDVGGSSWHDFLREINYGSDWNGEDMTLTDEQVHELVNYCARGGCFLWDTVERLAAVALLRGHKVVINADW